MNERVFPAYAGMSPDLLEGPRLVGGFPRLRGDEPALMANLPGSGMFSPPTRG